MPQIADRPGVMTRMLTRLTMDADGRLRGMRLLGIAFIAGLVVAMGTTAALVIGGAGSPKTLTTWVLVSFLGIKLPLLGLLWWILGRKQRDVEPTQDELSLMLTRLESSAKTALRTHDAHDRLEILRDEAWFVSEHADGDLKARAAELAVHLDVLTQSAPPAAGTPGH